METRWLKSKMQSLLVSLATLTVGLKDLNLTVLLLLEQRTSLLMESSSSITIGVKQQQLDLALIASIQQQLIQVVEPQRPRDFSSMKSQTRSDISIHSTLFTWISMVHSLVKELTRCLPSTIPT
jgi:hypothetical protein